MNKIIENKKLSENVIQVTLEAPFIAQARQPGQFILLQVDENGERIPLTIADVDTNAGTITLIVQVVGKTTFLLSCKKDGEEIAYVVGPLGTPTHIEQFGNVVCVGGGIGTAPLFPIAKALKEKGNHLTVILGARTKDLIILEDKMKAIADEFIVCTDDGSYGIKALVTQPLKNLCEKEKKPDLVVAIGPPLMMKFCSETTRPFHVKTLVSLNTIMIDGTGMCGGCRVNVGGKTQFVCVDGPEFDGHLVDFDNMIKRLNAYKKQEEHKYHECKLKNA
ncbi:MAG TPA: sulfide/dihydroorotate dehydrogenase-like FAD/NAD-binding protein [Candidatus Omnitrophota bacterium]|nr:sulfide/dihydroorotate dehydrogenase-like FAD/NAD-binding protein [Candidatus Omnitrophota bacterium]